MSGAASGVSEALWVILPAAGRGRRLDADTPKQYFPLGEGSVAECCLELFVNLKPRAEAIVVAVEAEEMERWRDFPAASDPRVELVEGGRHRADSVAAGLRALDGRAGAADWTLVHDIARPCLDVESVERLRREVAEDAVGGLLAVPLTDRLHSVVADRLAPTPAGEDLWRAQTPQMFRYALLEAALRDIDGDNPPRDEAQAMLAAGHAPKVVMGSQANIKITHEEDLALAQAWLATRKLRK